MLLMMTLQISIVPLAEVLCPMTMESNSIPTTICPGLSFSVKWQQLQKGQVKRQCQTGGEQNVLDFTHHASRSPRPCQGPSVHHIKTKSHCEMFQPQEETTGSR